jgi:predicted LPLAT superfamily acyltransferase
MLDGFVSFLERETLAYPGQWYQFYDFFLGDELDERS